MCECRVHVKMLDVAMARVNKLFTVYQTPHSKLKLKVSL